MRQPGNRFLGTYATILFIAGLLLTFIACTNDTYESGDGDYSYLRGDFSVFTTNSKSQITSITTDEGSTVKFASPKEIEGLKADTTYRALVYYATPVNADAELRGVRLVNVCKPFKKSKTKVLKTDPTGWESLWISNNKSYLNICINLLVGVSDDENADSKQVLGVCQDSIVGRHFYYTLYHDQNGVPEYYTHKSYMSIPLDSVFKSGDNITMTVHTYNGVQQKTVIMP